MRQCDCFLGFDASGFHLIMLARFPVRMIRRNLAQAVDRSFVPPPPPPQQSPRTLLITLAAFVAGGIWIATKEKTEDDADIAAFLNGIAARGNPESAPASPEVPKQ